MNDSCLPLVSVPVVTYNSSKTVIETLDSICNQSYPNIELIVSDDGSTDNTVQLCRDWMEAHKNRFARTEILTVEQNTGTSANLNRAETACQGEWVKGIAGDDLLLPDCVSDYMDYVMKNPDAIYVFGKMQFIGSPSGDYSMYEKVFDYAFFSLSPQEQLHKLVYESNCVPAPSCFYHLAEVKKMNINGYDERIPLLEDWPKWIKLLQQGVRFHFIDREEVVYRVGLGISNSSKMSADYYKTQLIFDYYYRYPEWVREEGESLALNRFLDGCCEPFNRCLELEREVERLRKTRAFRLGSCILKPISWLKNRL